MSKCNLLKPLQNNSGNFYIFSQYSDDLTKEYTAKDEHRVVPSKFIAMNIDNTKTKFTNNTLMRLFQNYYENHCCFWRQNHPKGWTPDMSLDLLIQTLTNNKLLIPDTITMDGGSKIYFPQIKYVGDINIYSNQSIDGMTYNEIYCYIPNDTTCNKYILQMDENPGISLETKSDCIQGFENEYAQLSEGEVYYNNIDLTAIYDDPDNKKFTFTNIYKFGEFSCINGDELEYNMNCIIVLYDIENKRDNSILHRNIPMGIYFTGTIQDDYTIGNEIKKYVSNGEVYDQGTSYGLRICTRYLSQPNIEILQDNVTIQSDKTQENLTSALSKMNDLQVLMTNATNQTISNIENLKSHYELFKNNKTNVPYIRNVGGEPYWFVNGTNTEVRVLDESKLNIKVNSITESEYNDISARYLTSASPTDVPNKPQNYISKYLEKYEMSKFAKDINSNYAKKNYVDDQVKMITDNFANDFLKKTDAQITYLTKDVADKSYLSISDAQSLASITAMNQSCTTSKFINSGLSSKIIIPQYSDVDFILMQETGVKLYLNDTTPILHDMIYISYDAEQYIEISNGGVVYNHSNEPILVNVKFDNNNLRVFISYKNIFRKLL